ncbi:hypothetical protein [Rhodobacter ferrooxidans]|uniref:Pilus assembly protein n=1 Tax=Rhodobacter ferrooxidans TaxID=371731 RepID=C8RXT0_9RHOB|nr:hypothetical protein [Rhodobacter sp. SW2]EEW26328.1 conserved hypothetical protein [Rhodobacter sp. SW2]
MLTRLKTLMDDESGAVMVDWVVLTAGVVGMGLTIMMSVAPATTQASASIAAELNAVQIQ